VAPRRIAALALTTVLAWASSAGASPVPPLDAKPTDPCSALRAAEYLAPTVPSTEVDVGDNAMACGRAYLAQAPLFAAPLFLEAGDAYEKAAVFSARLAQNVGASRDSQRRDATVYWALAWRSYSLAAQLNVTGAAVLAEKALTHIPEPKPDLK
jgi:hypothetical protein